MSSVPEHIQDEMSRVMYAPKAMPFVKWSELVDGLNPADVRNDCLVVDYSCIYCEDEAGYVMKAVFGYAVYKPQPHISEDNRVTLEVVRRYEQGRRRTAGTVLYKGAGQRERKFSITSLEMARKVVDGVAAMARPKFMCRDELELPAVVRVDEMARASGFF